MDRMEIQYGFNYLFTNILKLLATMRIYIFLSIIKNFIQLCKKATFRGHIND